MWWKRLWAPVACWTLVSIDMYLSGPFNYLDCGRFFRRHFVGKERVHLFMRDMQMTGSEYTMSDIHTIAEHDEPLGAAPIAVQA